ncbi:proton-translocating NADH-quinone oxidoreductase subunit L [Ectothiorhodospira sp. PHS-1]|uniref:NADH-quinone oxidoreductase subunit L n=1 Tax=Ectothiorhodospira sp. PHS-1 TaxID=519989 RepID=UPI00024A88FE|nr:NADH-quinone oxidoreductase subunit L [Ectothiorhodospira sp. PHS-1]EHQ52439.1 proton-translocating NADH-quinone oxidoreductase subunit L [Ectothiorhodospira sp. PHS-1]
MDTIYLLIVLAPLFGAIAAGLFGRQLGRTGAHTATIAGVAVSFLLSLVVFWQHVIGGVEVYNETVYTWLVSDGIRFEVGFLIDNLTALMMLVVTFVSLMVHIYTIGYMREDPGYQRFFALISLFTFSMLMLVMANNFMQLFFGWEAVGLVSYLLIGFWFKRPTAIHANLKAFIVNRVGDFAFVLGIAAIVFYTGSLDYATVFGQAEGMSQAGISVLPGTEWSLLTVACILLFIGAMAKSAQVPLHVWLPDSMEGPTPISALIHAATMVTAGIFMVARMSPLYEFSVTALSFVLIIGAVTAFFMGLVGLVQNDIKRVVAYSTLSQLGYMTVALGASAYAAGIFHLMTHAFFKALLFLAAGSVIMAMHHEQDIRRMGGLRKYMPITYATALIGSLALIGFPGLAGFFSKDGIIEAVSLSEIPGAGIAYVLILLGVFVTALYTFRMFFLVFHGEERFRHGAPGTDHDHGHDHEGHGHGLQGDPKESPWVVTVPLILLAIPSVLAGYFVGPLLFGDFFAGVIHVDETRDVLARLGEGYTGVTGFIAHGLAMPPFWLAMAGLATAWYVYMKRPDIADSARRRAPWAYNLLNRSYGFDQFNEAVFAKGTQRLGQWLWRFGDTLLIDTTLVNGSARTVGWLSRQVRQVQTGYVYHYAFAMIIGLLVLIMAFAF